ncbi:hypothetical protein SASPL_141835 [Salvia splendens]|uniref:Uncharacterized protein n=1 Tax=Salvia splendens TaxID=180675 RepID=A0A8X8Z8I5_SALSN|nr:hypothetical protein SASPL_141835 [Salvia splendens]
MSHHNCCNKQKVKRGLWSPEEDEKLTNYISTYGHGCWSTVPRLAGLSLFLFPSLLGFSLDDFIEAISLHKKLLSLSSSIDSWETDLTCSDDGMRPGFLGSVIGISPIPLDPSPSELHPWPIPFNQAMRQDHSAAALFGFAYGGGYDHDAAVMEALMPEVARGYEFGVSANNAAAVWQEQGIGGVDSGIGPLYPNHIRNISTIMETFVPPPEPASALVRPVSYLPPLPGYRMADLP